VNDLFTLSKNVDDDIFKAYRDARKNRKIT
jgi:hypothetical protein